MKEILNSLTNYETLTEKEASDIIIQISEGKLNTSEISSFLTIFMIRNITIEELSVAEEKVVFKLPKELN